MGRDKRFPPENNMYGVDGKNNNSNIQASWLSGSRLDAIAEAI